MTYTEIAAAIEAELNRPDKTGMTAQWVEDTYRDVLSREKFSWQMAVSTATTEANQYVYALPSDFYTIIDLVFNNGTTDSWRMSIYTAEEFDTLHPNVPEDTASKPEEACVINSLDADNLPFSELKVWPKPDLGTYTFTMKYEVIAPTLSAAVSPLIPSRFHQVLVFGSLRRGFAHLREYEAALYWEKQYEQMIARLITDDQYVPTRPTMLQPFSGGTVIYPPDYWKKYTVRGIR